MAASAILATVKAVAYPGTPPFADATVLGQRIRVLPRQWAALPAGSWPTAFAALPVAVDGSITVARSDVFKVGAVAAAAPNAVNCEQLMVAAAAFGAGTRARTVARARRPWTGAAAVVPTGVGISLAAAAAVLFAPAGGAVTAYAGLLRGAPNHVKFLGPAFFTKFLYFLGYGQAHAGLEPLILDSYVATGLNRLIGLGGPNPWILTMGSTDWSPVQYGGYLAWATREAVLGPVTSAQEAEYRIWLHGK